MHVAILELVLFFNVSLIPTFTSWHRLEHPTGMNSTFKPSPWKFDHWCHHMTMIWRQQQKRSNVDRKMFHIRYENLFCLQHYSLLHPCIVLAGINTWESVKFKLFDSPPWFTFEHQQRGQHLVRCSDRNSKSCSFSLVGWLPNVHHSNANGAKCLVAVKSECNGSLVHVYDLTLMMIKICRFLMIFLSYICHQSWFLEGLLTIENSHSVTGIWASNKYLTIKQKWNDFEQILLKMLQIKLLPLLLKQTSLVHWAKTRISTSSQKLQQMRIWDQGAKLFFCI